MLEISEAVRRFRKYKFEKMVYGVEENDLPLKQVFKILELMGFQWAINCEVVKYGKVVNKKNNLVKDFFKKIIMILQKEKKDIFPNLPLNKLNENLFLFVKNSVFYESLKKSSQKNFVFSIHSLFEVSNSFLTIKKGYDKASTIVEETKENDEFVMYDLEEEEFALVKKISQFGKVSLSALNKSNPSLIAKYCGELVNSFNKFIESCEIDEHEKKSFRLALVESFRQVLRNSMNLLGITIK